MSEVHYERHGSGEPLLLLTGFAISPAVFRPVLELYASRFECILYAHRGGLVTSMPELAADAATLLRRLRLDAAHVYGISMGGMVAQELALRFPERVRGLVLAATTPGGPRALRPAAGELARGRWLFSPEFRREHPERVRELLRYFELRPSALWAHWWATVYHDTVSRLGAIQAPTLVMHGGADALSPVGNARLLAAGSPTPSWRSCRARGTRSRSNAPASRSSGSPSSWTARSPRAGRGPGWWRARSRSRARWGCRSGRRGRGRASPGSPRSE